MSNGDALPVSEIGEWSLEKHARLKRYIDITRAVRRKFVSRPEATYIDLFAGPGRSKVRETGEIVDGSPVIAVSTARNGGAPFTDVFLADAEEGLVQAAAQRIRQIGAQAHVQVGPAETTVSKIVKDLNPYGLHFAFLDPFKLDPLPFSIIRELASLKRMDMLIHVSIHDLQRNLRLYMDERENVLERFAPGWRENIDPMQSDRAIRSQIFQHWLDLIRGLDMEPSEGVEQVSGSKNQPLYWLVLVSRNSKAAELWNKIRNVSDQRTLL